MCNIKEAEKIAFPSEECRFMYQDTKTFHMLMLDQHLLLCVSILNKTFFSIRNSWRVEKMQPNFIFLKIQSEYFINAIDSFNNKFFVAWNNFYSSFIQKKLAINFSLCIFNEFWNNFWYSIERKFLIIFLIIP